MFELVNVYQKWIENFGCLFCDEYCDANEDQSCIMWDGCTPFDDMNT